MNPGSGKSKLKTALILVVVAIILFFWTILSNG